MTGTALIPRQTIDDIEAHRAVALAKFQVAQVAVHDAMDAVSAVTLGKGMMHFGDREENYIWRRDEKFQDNVRKNLDRSIWRHLVDAYGFEQLMDRQAHDDFRDALEKDPPAATADVINATFEGLLGDAAMIFQRGIAKAFAKLDRRFRSHDGFKIGDRVVFNNALSDWGGWNHYSHRDEDIRDVERGFYHLDGKPQPDRACGIIGLIDTVKKTDGSFKVVPFICEDEYFRVRGFKNGNVHLWMKRDDLVGKINRILAQYYGEVLGAGSDTYEEDPLAEPNRSLAKNMGWFPTPLDVAQRVCGEAGIDYWRSDEPLRILEPSAGEGAIVSVAAALAPDAKIVCVEMHPGRAASLKQAGFMVKEGDFFDCKPDMCPKFDRIIMNPPFDGQRDIDHVAHAVRFLAPGGKLVAVMSAGIEFRGDKKSVAFRKLIDRMRGEIRDLPEGSFKESGTTVNTCLVTLNADREKPAA